MGGGVAMQQHTYRKRTTFDCVLYNPRRAEQSSEPSRRYGSRRCGRLHARSFCAAICMVFAASATGLFLINPRFLAIVVSGCQFSTTLTQRMCNMHWLRRTATKMLLWTSCSKWLIVLPCPRDLLRIHRRHHHLQQRDLLL